MILDAAEKQETDTVFSFSVKSKKMWPASFILTLSDNYLFANSQHLPIKK